MASNGWLLIATMGLLVGCGDDEGGTGGSGGSDAGPTTGAGGAAATIRFDVVILDAAEADDAPLEGIEVCAADHPEVTCATSDAAGHVALDLPAGSELMLRCQNEEFGPMYMTWAIGEEDIDAGSFRILPRQRIDFGLDLAGAEQWPSLGAIMVNVYEDIEVRETRVPDATFTLEPEAGGLAYTSAIGVPDPSLEASTVGGPGVFFDVADGEVTVSIAHPTRSCVGGFGWPTDSATSLRSRVFPGGLSNVTFVCPP